MTPAAFRADCEVQDEARQEARDQAREDQQAAWWPRWAKAARIDLPEPDREDGRLF